MKTFYVEEITDPNDRGEYTDFKRYEAAKRFAIKQSKDEGVIETFLSGEDEEDSNFEVMEYYKDGQLSIKVA